MRKIKVSVRNLVEFVLRRGDIDETYMSSLRGIEGTKAHQKVQASYGEDYIAEYSLGHIIDYKDFTLEVEGRADGIFIGDQDIMVEEIKSTNHDLDLISKDFNSLHWAQAKCYAYMYMDKEDLEEIKVKLTYYHLPSGEIKYFIEEYSYRNLKDYFIGLVEEYLTWTRLVYEWIDIRDRSIKKLKFPFDEYRKGQRELAVGVYKTIEEEKKIYIQAATGIGKTISSIFPSLKSLLVERVNKIFYLTAKTITREPPINSINLMTKQGLRLKTLVVTAKDKICLNDEVKCNPRDCEYARGHFDRLGEAVYDILKNKDMLIRETIIEYAKKHRVCPFEFSLELAIWVDFIICDYNYIFNPQVQFKELLEDKDLGYVFLIDEAHNLVDRARDMYSVNLNDRDLVSKLRIFQEKYKNIYKLLNKLINTYDQLNISLGGLREVYQRENFEEVSKLVRGLISKMDAWLVENKDKEAYEEVLELYFNLIRYNRIVDLYDEHYLASFEKIGENFEIGLNCIDPSYLLNKHMKLARASILFSATLTPLDYYTDVLGGDKGDYHMKLRSPFPRENLLVVLASNISTRYKDREKTYSSVAKYIYEFVTSKKGNYLIFFPSYAYMDRIIGIISEENILGDRKFLIQENDMGEEDRESFLETFEKEEGLIGFAVVGGIFSEGIDLIGDRLIGVGVIGVGMPKIGFKRDMIKDYYQDKMGWGFDYAYTYPGINRVLQASGRLIRSDKDRGIILLIDDRYGQRSYKELFPLYWSNIVEVKNQKMLKDNLSNFWNRTREEI